MTLVTPTHVLALRAVAGRGRRAGGVLLGVDHHLLVRQIMAGPNLGRTRSLYQDPGYGLRQLVDIAAQALEQPVHARRQALLARAAGHPAAAVVARPDPLGLG